MRKLYKHIYDQENNLYIKLGDTKTRKDFGEIVHMALVQIVEIKWKYFIKRVRTPFWDYEGCFIELDEYNNYVKEGLIKFGR